MKKIYVFNRESLELNQLEYDSDEELEEIYENYDEDFRIGGVLFLTEEEVKAIKKIEQTKLK